MELLRKSKNLIDNRAHDRRELPRYPIRREKIKFKVGNLEKVFALRDLSSVGLGIELHEHSEILLFPMGREFGAVLNLAGEDYQVELAVKRIDAASIGFVFNNLTVELRKKIEQTLDPLRIAVSLKSIRVSDSPNSMREGITDWFHGDMNTDLYLWRDSQERVLKALFFWNSYVWEWTAANGARTGMATPSFENKLDLQFDSSIQHQTLYQVRKILENATVLDYRLTEFLLHQI